nr:hypothetical protein [Actinomycetales bacterium]
MARADRPPRSSPARLAAGRSSAGRSSSGRFGSHPSGAAPAARPVRPTSGAAWRGLLWRWRHVFLAIGLAAGTLAFVDALSPDEGAPTLVLKVARPAGHVLTADDVRTVTLTPALDGVLGAPEEAVGEVLAVGLPAGSPLSTGMFVGPGLAVSAPSGTTVVTVALADPGSRELAIPGTKLTLVGETGPDGNVQQVHDVLVLSRLDSPAGEGLFATETLLTYVLVAVPSRMATLVLESSAVAPLRVALHSQH